MTKKAEREVCVRVSMEMYKNVEYKAGDIAQW
jgi:hypothetical protein